MRKELSEIHLVNASISGDTSEGGLHRLPAALDRFKPDLLIIELGGNDGLRGYSLKQLRSNLESMARLAQETAAEVLILGMQIPSNYGPTYTTRFAATFDKAAKATDSALVPFLLEPIVHDRDYFQADGIHPTAAAQPLIMQHVIESIRQIANSALSPQ